jgi:hypothetical protein
MLALFLKGLLWMVLVVAAVVVVVPAVSLTPKIMMLFSPPPPPPSLHVRELWPLLPQCEHVRDRDIFLRFHKLVYSGIKNNTNALNQSMYKEHNLERDYIFICEAKEKERGLIGVFLSLIFYDRARKDYLG